MINPVSWTWSKVWNSQIAQRIRGVQQQFERRDPDPGQTTLLGTPGTPSPRIPEESRLFSQRYDRRSIIYDVRRMLAENPLLAEAADDFVDTAISKSFSVTVETTAARGVLAGTQRKGQRIIDRVMRDASLKKVVGGWGKRALREGDVFIQAVEAGGRIVDAMAMPTVSMERLTDVRDKFADPMRAFRQIDITTNETLAEFAEWQIIHGRWNHEPGERYGNSQYLQLRTMNKIFLQMVMDMAIRRKVRGPLRRFHRVGSDTHPGSWQDVEKYIEINKLDEKAGIAEDYYGTFNVDVKTLEGDAKLSEIEDIQFVLNVLFPRMRMAKGLIGFGENVSRDILDDQVDFLHTVQDLFIDWLEFDTLRPLFDLALLLEDVNPDSLVYTVQFEDRSTERMKLVRCELYLELYEAGLMTDKQLVQRIAPYINVRNVEAYIDELKEWRAERLKQHREDLAGWSERKACSCYSGSPLRPRESSALCRGSGVVAGSVGCLVPTEPDPEERELIRRDLRAAISELEQLERAL